MTPKTENLFQTPNFPCCICE